MPGLIKAEDIELVKERASIEEVVREHVTLKSVGSGSLTGLCPFHDEKSPSFSVSPARGFYHCFGCGKGGDTIDFIMELEHLTFAETIEKLAGKYGVELRREEGGVARPDNRGQRQRLVEAHRVAEEFYTDQLLHGGPATRAGRDFLRSRDFDGSHATQFGVGFAPRDGEALAKHLAAKGFSPDELVLAGLVGRGSRGVYDRFRGRVVWPIRNHQGETVGFGARRMFDDDRIDAKYLNTAETPIYKKTQVLYGLDLAKKAIASKRRAVIVEGYTDVMAAHLSGVPDAVATCGTAFGVEHIKTLRRFLRDEPGRDPARVVFTFDGDAAGQKAAMRAFEQDEMWAAQSFVAVADGGADPCDLRQSAGPEAVQALVDSATPMFDFAVRTTLARFDLTSAEGRVRAAAAVAPMLAVVRDPARRPEYLRTVAGWMGMPIDQLSDQVQRAAHAPSKPTGNSRNSASDEPGREPNTQDLLMPNLRDPSVRAERQFLQCVLQFPGCVPIDHLRTLQVTDISAPMHRAVYEAILAADPRIVRSAQSWTGAVAEKVAPAVRPLIADLAVSALPARLDPDGRPDVRYVKSLLLGLRITSAKRQIDDVFSELRRNEDNPERSRETALRLTKLQRELSALQGSLE